MIETQIEVNEKNNDKTLVGSVIESLGGVLFAVELVDKTLSVASKVFKDNNNYQKSIKFLRGLSPAIITGHKIYTSVKSYKEKKKQIYARQKKSLMILGLMGQNNCDEYELDSIDFNLGKEIITWFTSRPKTNDFKIVEFYNSEYEILSTKNLDKGDIYILIEYKNCKYMIEVDILVMNLQIFVTNCQIHYIGRTDKLYELKSVIYGEFIKFFDIKNNVIELTAKGLQTRPRMGFEYDIKQFDVSSFKDEIIKAIDKRKKRGYVLVGPPGVGKSTILIKLEKELPNIPIVYVSSSGNVFREDVVNTFSFLRSISPCVCIFEDIDGYELAQKQDKIFGEFIENLDGLKHKDCIIVIATLNEPENVHPSLINRRGRFDRVYFIDYPKTMEEFFNIINNKFNKELGKDFPENILDEQITKKMIDNDFSQSDICECIESLIINDLEISKNSLNISIDEVINSINALKMCKPCNIDIDNLISTPVLARTRSI